MAVYKLACLKLAGKVYFLGSNVRLCIVYPSERTCFNGYWALRHLKLTVYVRDIVVFGNVCRTAENRNKKTVFRNAYVVYISDIGNIGGNGAENGAFQRIFRVRMGFAIVLPRIRARCNRDLSLGYFDSAFRNYNGIVCGNVIAVRIKHGK